MSIYYDRYRVQIQTGDLCEFCSDTLLGSFIRLRTGKDVNHTAVFVWLGNPNHTFPPRLFLIEALEDGVVVSLFSYKVGKHKGRVYWLPLMATQEQRYRMEYYLLTKAGQRCEYDFESLRNLLLSSVPPEESRLFCSELVQFSLFEAGFEVDMSRALVPGAFSMPYVKKRIILKTD